MKSIAKACEDPQFPARISLVVSNRPDTQGLEWAQSQGFKTACVDHKKFDTRENFEKALIEVLKNEADAPIDLICLAGFMRILSPHFLANTDCAIINIHPSLLPLYKGTNTHARALADKQTYSGCSVHYATEELDSGDIIVQKRVPVLANDTPETLAARVLEQEHIAYPEAIRTLAEKHRTR